ncbi:MAG: hypothetical protein WCB19_05500 [Thermoplasmata archaeon]
MSSHPSNSSLTSHGESTMKTASLRSLTLTVFGLIAALWFLLTLVALVASIVGGNPLYTVVHGSVALPQLSLLGQVYLVSSGLMPFIVIGAIASA